MLRFSKSKLNTFLACSEKYRLHYELGIRSPKTSKTLVEGSCIHHLVESGLMYGQYLDDILEQASHSFWGETPFDRCDYETEEEYLSAQQTCLVQSRSFLEQLGPLQARDIELHLESRLIHPITGESDQDIGLIGYIDLVINDQQGNPWLIDLKTVGRKPREGMSRIALELSMYAYLYSLPFEGISFPQVPVALVYLVRTKEPYVIWDESRRSLPDFMELHRICRKVAEDIRREHFFKNPGMHCSWCDFSSLCYAEPEKAVEVFGEDMWTLYLLDQENREENVLTAASAVNF